VGLGVLVSEAQEVTEELFLAAAAALSDAVSVEDRATGSLFPRIEELRRVTARVAEAVVREALNSGVARRRIDDAEAAVSAAMWDPAYAPLDAIPVSRSVELAFSGA
jgi:malic enzyme